MTVDSTTNQVNFLKKGQSMGVMAYKLVSAESFKGRDIISMRDFNR